MSANEIKAVKIFGYIMGFCVGSWFLLIIIAFFGYILFNVDLLRLFVIPILSLTGLLIISAVCENILNPDGTMHDCL